MSDLRNLQYRFQDYLLGLSEEIEKDIVSSSEALAEHRLGTYYNAYRIRLIDCLAIDYSALQKYLGEQAFENLSLDYLNAHPSTHPSVRWFGKDLGEYLRSCYTHKDRDFLSELANFEWAQGLVFDEANASSIVSIEDMAQIPQQAWPSIQIHFIAAMRCLDLYWNVCPYWVALDKSEKPPQKQPSEYPLRWLVWRKGPDPHWRSLEVHEAWALQAAQNGANFAELCEGLCEWISENEVALIAAGFLKQWISDELIVGIDFQ